MAFLQRGRVALVLSNSVSLSAFYSNFSENVATQSFSVENPKLILTISRKLTEAMQH